MQERRNSSALAMELRLSCITHRYVKCGMSFLHLPIDMCNTICLLHNMNYMLGQSNVSMVFADSLAFIWCQDIRNKHAGAADGGYQEIRVVMIFY